LETVEKFETRLQGETRPFEFQEEFRTLRVRLQLSSGDLQNVSHWADQVSLSEDFRLHEEYYRFTLARIRLAQGRYAEADKMLTGMPSSLAIRNPASRQIESNWIRAAAAAGQNLGAGKPERSVQAVRAAAGAGLIIAACVSTLFLLIPEQLVAVFGLTDPTVVAISRQLLGYLAISAFFITVALTYTGGLQGTGDTRSPLYITLVSQIAVPLGICTVMEAMGDLQPSSIWTAIVLGHITRCTLSVWRFRQRKWVQIAVDIGGRK